MLDTFEIITTSGVVIWSRKWAPVKPSIIDNFITDVFVEEKSASGALKANNSAASNPPYKTDQHTLRWTFVKELGLIFVVSFAAALSYRYHASIVTFFLFSHLLMR